MGEIVTFYSYKGGVGRTMTLANVAVLLARWGYKALIVDWDLEAPGIEYFFKRYLDVESVAKGKGIVDLLHSVSGDAVSSPQTLDWQNLTVSIQVPECKQPLHLLSAGERGDGYFGKVRSFDVGTFYAEKKGGLLIESLRDEWKKKYDFVLLDSRTGVTDIGGICTIQLPDLLVMVFTATEQSFKGITDIARRAAAKRQQLPIDRLRLLAVPLPSRFDSQVEFKISQEWLDRFAKELSDIYTDWLPKSVDTRKLLEATKIPYIPYFSFGEKLAVIEQGTTDPAGLGYAYETLAAMIANNLESVEQLLINRAEFVRTASRSEVALLRPDTKDEPDMKDEPVTTDTFNRERLESHREWIESDGRRGRRLGLAKAILKGIDLSGANLRKADLTEADVSGAILVGSDLCEAVLVGANLKEARLSKSNLQEANIQNANLFAADLSLAQLPHANLKDADLRNANLSEAVLTDAKIKGSKLNEANFYRSALRRVSFEGCDIRRASFKEADLQDADLNSSEELITTQLAGANLSGARVPAVTNLLEPVAEVNSKAWFHRLRYVALLIGCAYAVWVAIDFFSAANSYKAKSTNIHRFTNESAYREAETAARSAFLVIRTTALRTFGVIPMALFAFFLYFQFSLQSVWAALAAMPDGFPDGKSLDRKILPAFISKIVRLYLRQKGGDEPPSYRFQGSVVALSLWFAVPLLLVLLFAETLFAQKLLESYMLRYYSVILFLLWFASTLSGIIFWRAARRSLRRDPPKKRALLWNIFFRRAGDEFQ